MIDEKLLKNEEKAVFFLRSLYKKYGYLPYKMSKFEEYELYMRNKDFLVSDRIITFNDTNGKLMALKPDVTLSIVKNTVSSNEKIQKLYYNENVYRVSESSKSFREIMQVGLECIGETDDYCLCEVLSLAEKSLKTVSENCILDISCLDILLQVLDYIGVPEKEKRSILRLAGEKNIHEIAGKCRELGLEKSRVNVLTELICVHGSIDTVLPEIKHLLNGIVKDETLGKFANIICSLPFKEMINIDFSVSDDINYYNGIVFKGFVQGVPGSVLSGGQYDVLMKKMKRSDRAVGFAVYTDMLELLGSGYRCGAETLILYDNSFSADEIMKTADSFRHLGSVTVIPCGEEYMPCKRTVKMINGRVETIENNA